MVNKKAISYGLIILLLLFLAGAVWASQSAGTTINWWVMSSGGSPVTSTSGDITINSSLGQTAVGRSTSSTDNISIDAGYWYPTAENDWQLHLPIILDRS